MKNLKLYENIVLSLILIIGLYFSSAGPTNAIILTNNSTLESNSSNNLSLGITNSSLDHQSKSSDLMPSDVNNRALQNISYYEGLKQSLPKWQSKLSTDLLVLVNNSFLLPRNSITSHISDMKKMNQYVPASSIKENSVINKSHDDMVLVYIYLSLSSNTNIVDNYTWYVLNRNEQEHYVIAYVELENLERLASLDDVKNICTITPPVNNTGSVNPLSDIILGTNQTRLNYHINGSGISVGIISTGINNYTDSYYTGDLPSNPQLTILPCQPWPWGYQDEGTAMAEIIYDLVPNATIYYADEGIIDEDFLVSANTLASVGCNIIVDDLTYYYQPWFEDGTITTGLRTLYNQYPNVTLVTSAGNFANQSYQGDYYNDGTNCMDFSRGTSDDKRLHITLPPGAMVKIALQWNDPWGNSSNNYDLYLIDNQTNATVAQCINSQNGQGCNPYEFISYTNNGSTTKNYDISVSNYEGLAQTRTLKLLAHFDNGGSINYIDPGNFSSANSIVEHNGMPEEISVGAIYEYTYYLQYYGSDPLNYLEFYSSQGPVTLSYPTPTVIPKPDICGLDGVEISHASSVGEYWNNAYRFFGTSAAAPGVAGILAQLECGYPGLTRDQYRSMLFASTGSSWNSADGYGLANASAMYPLTSSYVSDTISSMMSPGQEYSVSVTMLNNWTTDWSRANGIVLVGLNDSSLFGPAKVLMDDSTVVHPGESYTWHFMVTAPSQVGIYQLRYRLAWDGYAGGSGYGEFGDNVTRYVSTYPYSKTHLINGSTDGALTDYQVQFLVHNTTGTDSARDIYLNGGSLSWPNDFRLTNADNHQKLSYWIESYNSTVATVWVKVDSIAASPATTRLNIYYGKADDLGESDGDATFVVFDHFDGSSLNSSKWVQWGTGSGTVNNSSLRLSATGQDSVMAHCLNSVPLTSYVIETQGKVIYPYQGSKYRPGLLFRQGSAQNSGAVGFDTYAFDQNGWTVFDWGAWSWYDLSSTASISPGDAYGGAFRLQVTVNGSSYTCREALRNKAISDSRGPTGSYFSLLAEKCTDDYDWVFVRKYTQHEPIQSMSMLEGTIPDTQINVTIDQSYNLATDARNRTMSFDDNQIINGSSANNS